jgi:uncharacterized protein
MKIIRFSLKILSILCFALAFIDLPVVNAQPPADPADTIPSVEAVGIHGLARHMGSEVHIRWAPEKADVWLMAHQFGYLLVREELNFENPDPDMQPLVIDTIFPYPMEQWVNEATVRDQDAYFNIALQTIHGQWETHGMGSDLISMIAKNDEMQNRYAFNLLASDFDFEAARYSGLGYIDRTVESQKVYQYFVYPNFPEDLFIPVLSSPIMADPQAVILNPDIIFEAMGGEEVITLRWNREFYDQYYTAYWIERSENNRDFERLNNIPFIHALSGDEELYTPFITFSDSVANYNPYYYRVIGIDPFGELSSPAEALQAFARDATPPPAPSITSAAFVENRTVEINWEMEETPDLRGFYVSKGYEYGRPFSPISDLLGSTVRTFRDTNANTLMPHYYMVTAVDTAGNQSTSFQFYAVINDTIPPAAPTGLTATADTTGFLVLSWNRNPEDDILGYKVQFANDSLHEFSILTGEAIVDTFFVDKIALNSLTPYIYYKVFAVDLRYNYSEQSAMLTVKRPDTIPPVPPVFYDFQARLDTNTVMWYPSSSQDAVSQRLYKSPDGITWVLTAEFDNEVSHYDDLKPGNASGYYYRIVAIDDAGLLGLCPEDIYLDVVKSVNIAGVKSFRIEEVDQRPQLAWEYDGRDDVKFIIFKAVGDIGFQRYREFTVETTSFTDPLVSEGVEFRYTIMVRSLGGRDSGFSEVLSFRRESD